MSRPARRLTLQLTPLLDLLLIVIFAQFMEVRETDARRAAAAAHSEARLAAAERELAQHQSALADAFRLITQARRAMESSQELVQRHREDLVNRERSFEESLQRQQTLARLLVDYFQVPRELLDSILDSRRGAPLAESEEALERLRQEFRQLAEGDPGRIVKHLLTFDEVRKRCDIWELHLQASPRRLALLDPARQHHDFALPLTNERPGADLDQSAFERDLYSRLKSWPQPKSLVEVLFSYDADVRINVRDQAQESILRVLDRLRTESAGRTRFEFADFGIPLT